MAGICQWQTRIAYMWACPRVRELSRFGAIGPEKENDRLRRAVADPMLYKQILAEAPPVAPFPPHAARPNIGTVGGSLLNPQRASLRKC